MKKKLLWITVAAILLLSFFIYRTRSQSNLNVTPDAADAIEKAKRR